LPPIHVEETDSGTLRVANGFHRYYASVILGYLEIPVVRKIREHRRSIHTCVDSKAELRIEDVLLLKEMNEEGDTAFVEAFVIAPKTSNSKLQGRNRHQIAQTLPCKPRYEPPAVRRERQRKEELERRRRELAEKSTELKRTVFVTFSRGQEHCHQIRKSGLTYAETIIGRAKPRKMPAWKDEPTLPETIKSRKGLRETAY